MSMPIFSYFLIVGTILFSVLLLVGNQLEPAPLRVSQKVGLPARFKAPPENMQSGNDAMDFATKHSVNDQTSNGASKQKRTNNPS